MNHAVRFSDEDKDRDWPGLAWPPPEHLYVKRMEGGIAMSMVGPRPDGWSEFVLGRVDSDTAHYEKVA